MSRSTPTWPKRRSWSTWSTWSRRTTTADDDLPDDPGAVLEDDVAAVLAEGEALERGEVAASADESEDAPDGPVPHED